jgi:hypothetical protein
VVRYGVVRYGVVRYGVVRYGVVRYGVVVGGSIGFGVVVIPYMSANVLYVDFSSDIIFDNFISLSIF